MARQRVIVLGLLLASSLVLSGCKKKKPPVPPPQAQAPTITDTTGVPAAIPEVAVPQPEPKPEAPTPPVARKPKKKIRAPKADAKKAVSPATQQPATNPASEVVADKAPSKVVVEAGGKSDPTPPPLVADTANEQAARQRLSTAQLINTAETNIRNIARQLSVDEEAIVQHIRGYIEQSRQASKDGDTERAYNLAVKAQLLSDSLKK